MGSRTTATEVQKIPPPSPTSAPDKNRTENQGKPVEQLNQKWRQWGW